MAKQKFHYNPTTCNYEPIQVSTKDILFDMLGLSVLVLIFSATLLGIYVNYFDSPKEALLRQENTLLKSHYQQLQQKITEGEQWLALLQENDDHLYRLLLNANPLPSSIRKAGTGGTERYQDLRDQHALIAETTEKVDTLRRQLSIQQQSYQKVLQMAKSKEKRLARLPAIIPIANKNLKRISSHFGLRLHPVLRIYAMHRGVDLAARRGTPVYATADGVVVKAKYSPIAGNYIVIDHGHGFITKYCHLHNFSKGIKPGISVVRGQDIGHVGNTGRTTAPHLHYEILKKEGRRRKHVNPAHYFCNDLNAREYNQLLQLAARRIAPSS